MEVEVTHQENNQLDDQMFSTMAPNVGPLHGVDERRESGYYSGDRSAVNFTIPLECERGGGERESSLPTGTGTRYETLRQGGHSHQPGWTSSGGNQSEEEESRAGPSTRQSRHRTRHRRQYEADSPCRVQPGWRNSGATASDGARGSQLAGPDDPLQGVGVDRPIVTGLRDPSLSGGALGPSTDRSNNESRRRPVLPTLKLGTYDGSTCLMTFLAKFENCIDYYGWTSKEQLCHLQASLEDAAGQVLWDAGKQGSVYEVIRLLKSRFGTSNEEERYRSELHSRRRRRGESLQSVYRDVRRLMALAFPGQSGSLWEIMARDAFVDALPDPNLRCRILERDPSTLEQALKVASRLEALSRSVGHEDPNER